MVKYHERVRSLSYFGFQYSLCRVVLMVVSILCKIDDKSFAFSTRSVESF